jgi:hypothetical protein
MRHFNTYSKRLRLTEAQSAKLEMMRAFLKTDLGSSGIILPNSSVTDIWNLKSIFSNCTGVYMHGMRPEGSSSNDRIEYNQISAIYRCALKDDDFRDFVDEQACKADYMVEQMHTAEVAAGWDAA